jgi:hypothetical protein
MMTLRHAWLVALRGIGLSSMFSRASVLAHAGFNGVRQFAGHDHERFFRPFFLVLRLADAI